MSRQSTRYYEFGPFRLNVTERLLQKNDELVPLTPKLVDTLVALVENSQHVVSKEELMQLLWPNSFVEESSLTQNISLLRKALSENGTGRQYIETIPKRGYRFVGDAREVIGTNEELVMRERTSTALLIEEHLDDSREPDSDPRSDIVVHGKFTKRSTSKVYPAILAACVLLLSAVAFYSFRQHRLPVAAFVPKSIAVLPFKTIGPEAKSELMGLGMADAVIHRLSHLSNTTVLPTSSVFRYTDREKDVLSIGRDLRVDAVLDGTMQHDGDWVRITTQLIRVSDGKTVWSEKFDDRYSSVFALQDVVSQKVASAVMPTIQPQGQGQLSNHGTENKEAYNAYLTGLYFWNRRSKENLSKAISYLEEAVQKDANFARAHAMLADCYYLTPQEGYQLLSRTEALAKAAAAAERALQLDDTMAEAHTAKAAIALAQSHYEESEQEFRRALDLNPNYAVGHLRYSYFLFVDSRIPEAIAQMERAVELDPVSPVSHVALGFMLFMSRDYDGAVRENLKALELQPDLFPARVNLVEAYIQKGMFEQAVAETEKNQGADPQLVKYSQAHAYFASGRTPQGMRSLSELQAMSSQNSAVSYNCAVLFAASGNKDKAFEWLEKLKINRTQAAIIKFDPQLDSLRGDKRFADLLQRETSNILGW
jgi:DNA-binding winged helix-turn-helix (wHTH) protein/TolB-like protein/tetratricopeptide (TPR) repeat protein